MIMVAKPFIKWVGGKSHHALEWCVVHRILYLFVCDFVCRCYQTHAVRVVLKKTKLNKKRHSKTPCHLVLM